MKKKELVYPQHNTVSECLYVTQRYGKLKYGREWADKAKTLRNTQHTPHRPEKRNNKIYNEF